MNLFKVFSVSLLVVFFSLLTTPGSDAIGPLTVFTAAKLATMGVIGKGAILVPKLVLAKAAILGGMVGGHFATKIKTPLLLAKSSLPSLISLAPLLRGKKKKETRQLAAPIPAAPVYTPPAPVYAPQPMYAPSYTPQMPSYVPMAPTYSQNIRTGY